MGPRTILRLAGEHHSPDTSYGSARFEKRETNDTPSSRKMTDVARVFGKVLEVDIMV